MRGRQKFDIRNDSESVFIFDSVRNRSIHSSKNMYPYIVLEYRNPPPGMNTQEISFEIGMFFDKLKEKRLTSPVLRITCSSNAILTTDNGERDKPMTKLTRKTLRTNRITRFKVNVRGSGVTYIGFFGDGVRYIDYLSLLDHITIDSKYLHHCDRLENLIVSPASTIKNFDMNDIPDSIRFLKLDNDLYEAQDADIEKLIDKKYLSSLYLVGSAYTGDVYRFVNESKVKNASIIAPKATGYKELHDTFIPNVTTLDASEYYFSVSIMRD